MDRDLGVTEAIRANAPEWSIDLAELLALGGDLLLIVPVLALLLLADITRTVATNLDGGETPPLYSPRTIELIATVFGGLSLLLVLESLFALGRPPESWHAISPSPYGFPSGHTMAATIFWGALALWYPVARARVRIVTVAGIVSLVGFSRLLLGVHFLVDIIAAVVAGVLYLVAIDRWLRGRPTALFGLAIAVAILAVAVTGGTSRTLLAAVGTVGAAIGWQLLEATPVRRFVYASARTLVATK